MGGTEMKIINLRINSCGECPFYRKKKKYCTLRYESLKYTDKREMPEWCPLSDDDEEFLKNHIFRCIYCGGVGTIKEPLFSVYAPGTIYQHWDFEKQKGCSKNEENIAPNGKKVMNNP